MPLYIKNSSILQYAGKVDAMVVPANKNPAAFGGLDAEMYDAAGYEDVLRQRVEMGVLHIGEAKATDGFMLAKYLIHTATPLWCGGRSGERKKLRNCYENSIRCAAELGAGSIAFPLLSAGNMGFPKGIAYENAVQAINECLSKENSIDVYLIMYDNDEFDDSEHAENIFNHWDCPMEILERNRSVLSKEAVTNKEILWYYKNITEHITLLSAKQAQEIMLESEYSNYISDNPEGTEKKFLRERFYSYLDNCGIKAAKLAEMMQCSKSTISRIKSGETLNPQKRTVIALAIAMKLSTVKRIDFINCSGHAYPIDHMDFYIEQLLNRGYTRLDAINDRLYERNKSWLLIGDPKDDIKYSER